MKSKKAFYLLLTSMIVVGLSSVTHANEAIQSETTVIEYDEEIAYVGLERKTPTILDSDQDGVTLDKDQCRSTPFGVPVDEQGCAICTEGTQRDDLGCYRMVNETKVIPLHIKFDTDSVVIKDSYKAKIYQFVNMLDSAPVEKITIEGHTDSVGNDAYNKDLSDRRAKEVALAMENFGIASDKLSAKGYGEEKPVADNDSKDGRMQNRRVNAVVELQTQVKVYSVRL